MTAATALRTEAQAKREMAEALGRVRPGLSLSRDRDLFAEHAGTLLAEATELEAQADALDPPASRV